MCEQPPLYKEDVAYFDKNLSHIDHALDIEEPKTEQQCSTPGYCLKLPGKKLNLTALLYAKKFRNHNYKSGALAAFRELEKKD